jgi:membrane protease YdiL (CAAX protease family)
MAIDFRAIIDSLINIGFYSVFLPFLLVYVVVFAILEKSNFFTGGNSNDINARKIHSIIAFIFGVFVVASIQTVMYIQSLIINSILFIIFFLVLLILLSFVLGEEGVKSLFDNRYVKWSVFGIIIFVVLIIFLNMIGFFEYVSNLNIGISSDDVYTFLILAGIIGILVWISKGDSGGKNGDSGGKK